MPGPDRTPADPCLRGVRVVDAAGTLAGAYCAKVLTDLGADVVVVEPAGGEDLRGWSSTGSVGTDGYPDGALFRHLRSGQRSVVGDDARDRLVAGADVVLGLDPAAVRAANPDAIAVTVDAFGRGSSRAGDDPGELLLQALSGSLSARGDATGAPVYVNEGGGQVSQYLSGAFAAVTALAALVGRHERGTGDAIEVSTLEVQALTLVNYPTVTASFPYQAAETVRWLSIPGIEPCADGYVGFFVVTGQQWLDFLVMIERPELGEQPDLLTMPGRMARKDELLEVIRAWTTTRPAVEITELAALFRVPAALIGRGDTMPQFDHLRARHSFTSNPRGGFTQPASPFRLSNAPRAQPAPSPDPGAHTDRAAWSERAPATTDDPAPPSSARPLTGLRVLDLTNFWAGPIATQLLASLGADVIRIESIQRPDPQRFNTRVPRTEAQWYETASVFVAPNLAKRGITVNLTDERGRAVFERLLVGADLVVENYTPRVLENFGLTYERIAAVNPRVILVRMPAFGLDGPWRDRPGFAQTVSQAGGISWTTGSIAGDPMNPGAVCDPMSGLHAIIGALAAVEQRRRTGVGQLVEVPMIDVVLNMTVEQTVEWSAYGRLLRRQGNRGPQAAPQGAYRVDGTDDWIALAVATDAEWAALCRAVDRADWAARDDLASATGRRAAHDELDDGLAAWCVARTAHDALDALRAAGVPAEPVVPAHLADTTAVFEELGTFETVDHPVVGPKRYPGWPFTFASFDEPWFPRPAPLLGEHNDEVLTEAGFTADEIAELRAQQVIGEVPLGL